MEQEPARSRDRTRAASSNAGADVDKRTKRFLVLVPHGNIRALMTSPRAELLRRGWLGAYSFPVVAPLAVLHRPLSPAELAAGATALRQFTTDGGRRGCIPLAGTGTADAAGLCALFGLVLVLPALTLPDDAVSRALPPVLCLAAFSSEGGLPTEPVVPGPFSFKSGALANMTIRPLGGTLSFAWRIGRLAWLPRWREAQEGRPKCERAV